MACEEQNTDWSRQRSFSGFYVFDLLRARFASWRERRSHWVDIETLSPELRRDVGMEGLDDLHVQARREPLIR